MLLPSPFHAVGRKPRASPSEARDSRAGGDKNIEAPTLRRPGPGVCRALRTGVIPLGPRQGAFRYSLAGAGEYAVPRVPAPTEVPSWATKVENVYTSSDNRATLSHMR
jgi:hypothetical protein